MRDLHDPSAEWSMVSNVGSPESRVFSIASDGQSFISVTDSLEAAVVKRAGDGKWASRPLT
jgi:hypothetical protein